MLYNNYIKKTSNNQLKIANISTYCVT